MKQKPTQHLIAKRQNFNSPSKTDRFPTADSESKAPSPRPTARPNFGSTWQGCFRLGKKGLCLKPYVGICISDMLLGYALVSTKDQDLTLQTDALTKAGCERIFTDHGVSGAALTKDICIDK